MKEEISNLKLKRRYSPSQSLLSTLTKHLLLQHLVINQFSPLGIFIVLHIMENRELSNASRTITAAAEPQPAPTYTLQLRPRATLTWDESVVDNENLGRKSSKKCWIYHKPKAFDESDTESEGSGSDSDSSDGGPQRARPTKKAAKKKHHRGHGHDHDHDHHRHHHAGAEGSSS